MVHIQRIEQQQKETIEQITTIHLNTFQGFFLTFMGKGFLRQMYCSYCDHPESSILVATNGNDVVGFLAYSADLSGLYKYMIKKRLIPFAWYAAGAFFRKPKIFLRLVRAFLKPGESKREEQYVELASIGVSPEVKGQGVGSALIRELQQSVDFNAYAYITLETDAVDNEAANHFYQKNGFTLVRTFQTKEGRQMNEYRFRSQE